MNELRKDYLLDRWVIIASDRAKRPQDFKKPKHRAVAAKDCAFCEGKTPEETYRYEQDGRWMVRVVKNKYPAVAMVGDPKIDGSQPFFTHGSAYGQHEVLIESPDHRARFHELSPEHIYRVLDACVQRIRSLNDLPGIRYTTVFKNHGIEAGASLTHPHFQIIAYNHKPDRIREELEACYDHIVKNETCPYCDIIPQESSGIRKAYENDSVVAFCPYASVYPFEVWVYPKKHLPSVASMNEKELRDLGDALRYLSGRLDSLGNPPYNMVFVNGEPTKENFHFHVSIMPRLATWAGFELETGTIINTMPPEQAAMFYRGESDGGK